MKITQAIKMAFASICSTKLRSFLTMLGIIIGIASIIAIVSTIKGTSEQIKEDLIGAGNNIITIRRQCDLSNGNKQKKQ
jgi:putative ABC transport system permease protein